MPPAELAIDELHLNYPSAGSRTLRDVLRSEGVAIGRQLVAALMRRIGIEALIAARYVQNTEPGNKIYSYLPRSLKIDRLNQIWADITYIPMSRGFVYLAAAVIGSRAACFRRACRSRWRWRSASMWWRTYRANRARLRFSIPTRSSQFTSAAFTGLLLENNLAISMDGRGAWRHNVFVERLWRLVKYEGVYLRDYDSVAKARATRAQYFMFYNTRRPHSSLYAQTPDHAYFNHLPFLVAA